VIEVWIIAVIMGKTVGAWGPVPFTLAECTSNLPRIAMKVDEAFEKGTILYDGRLLKRQDVTLNCVQSSTRPKLG